MESLKNTDSLLPSISTEFVPAISGQAVAYLADCPRTPLVQPLTQHDSQYITIKTPSGGAFIFNDLTALIFTKHAIFPLPLLSPAKPAKSSIEHLIANLPWKAEATLDKTAANAVLTPGLTPAWRPLLYKPNPYELDILKTYTHALLYALLPTHPCVATCQVRWRSQPIAPSKILAPHSIRLYPKDAHNPHPNLAKTGLEANTLLRETASILPLLPGQSLRDSRQSRITITTIPAPDMTSAHAKLDLETNPFLSIIRAALPAS